MAIAFMCKNRLELLTFLENNHVQTRVCFAGNVTRHPVYREYLEEFKNADRIMAEGFLLGCHHGMKLEDCDYVCNKIKEFLPRKRLQIDMKRGIDMYLVYIQLMAWNSLVANY
jgi:CDP-4-dehydro-6-deoxyglucose reductase, E1